MRIQNFRLKIKNDLFEVFKAKFSDVLTEQEILVLWYFTEWNNGYIDIAAKLNLSSWENVKEILEGIDAKLLAAK